MARGCSFAIELRAHKSRLTEVVSVLRPGIEESGDGHGFVLNATRLFTNLNLDPQADDITLNLRRRMKSKEWFAMDQLIPNFTAEEDREFRRLMEAKEEDTFQLPWVKDRFCAWLKNQQGEGELWKHYLRFTGTSDKGAPALLVGRLCQMHTDLECEFRVINLRAKFEHWVGTDGVLHRVDGHDVFTRCLPLQKGLERSVPSESPTR